MRIAYLLLFLLLFGCGSDPETGEPEGAPATVPAEVKRTWNYEASSGLNDELSEVDGDIHNAGIKFHMCTGQLLRNLTSGSEIWFEQADKESEEVGEYWYEIAFSLRQSPEAVARHIENYLSPWWKQNLRKGDPLPNLKQFGKHTFAPGTTVVFEIYPPGDRIVRVYIDSASKTMYFSYLAN